MKRFIYALASGLIALALIPISAFAATATLYLSPSSSSVSNGSTISIRVYENSGSEPVNGVQANLSYPANLLDFVSITSSSAFGIVAQSSGGGGSVQIGRGAQPAVSGTQLVATVRFRAKASSGTANISINGDSAVVSANSNTNIRSGGGGSTLNLKPPAPAAQPAAEAPKDTTPPTIKDIKAMDIKINSVVIAWTTSEPASSEVSYGLTESYGLTAGDTNPKTDHKVTLSFPNIVPATKYHYTVRSVDPAGNAVAGDAQTFTSQGLSLLVTVVNQDNKKLEGAEVNIAGKTARTNKDGQATVTGLPVGKHSGVVKYQNESHVVNAELTTSDISEKPKPVTFTIETRPNILVFAVPTLLILAVIALLAIRPAWRAKLLSYSSKLKRPLKKSNTPTGTASEASLAPPPVEITPTSKRP